MKKAVNKTTLLNDPEMLSLGVTTENGI